MRRIGLRPTDSSRRDQDACKECSERRRHNELVQWRSGVDNEVVSRGPSCCPPEEEAQGREEDGRVATTLVRQLNHVRHEEVEDTVPDSYGPRDQSSASAGPLCFLHEPVGVCVHCEECREDKEWQGEVAQVHCGKAFCRVCLDFEIID